MFGQLDATRSEAADNLRFILHIKSKSSVAAVVMHLYLPVLHTSDQTQPSRPTSMMTHTWNIPTGSEMCIIKCIPSKKMIFSECRDRRENKIKRKLQKCRRRTLFGLTWDLVNPSALEDLQRKKVECMIFFKTVYT